MNLLVRSTLTLALAGLTLAASAAPLQGEHTVAVLRELLGASDQQIDELKKAGVI